MESNKSTIGFLTTTIITAAILAKWSTFRNPKKPLPTKKRKGKHIQPALLLKFPGLLNIGNSCYMNSCLQMLASSNILPAFLQDLEDSHLAAALHRLLKELRTAGSSVVDPRPFLMSVFGTTQLGFDQQDAQEFLLSLLNRLSLTSHGRSIQRTDSVLDYSRLCPFEGIESSQIDCRHCNSIVSMRLVIFTVLTLETAPSVAEALRSFSKPEHLDGYRCKCGAVSSCFRSSKILRWPQILLIHLNRIRMSNEGHQFKDKTDMHVDLEILDGRYKLKSLVEHGGAINNGHYVAYRKTSRSHFQLLSDADSQVVSRLTTQPYLLLFEQT